MSTNDNVLKLPEKKVTINEVYRYNKDGEITAFYPSIYCNEFILKNRKIIAFGDDESTLLYYDESRGIYAKMYNELDVIMNDTMHLNDPSITTNRKKVKDETFRRAKKVTTEDLNSNKNLINFKNGLYDLKERKLKKHSYKVYSTIQANGNYIPEKLKEFEGSLFESFLTSTFDSEVIPIIQEMLGYIITSFTEAQKMFFLEGSGGNGKSSFLEICMGMFNSNDVTNVSIDQIQKQEYAIELATSAFNSCGDIDSTYINNPGIIKQITGGTENEKIMARTLFGKPMKFRPTCKLMFSANSLPSSSDKNNSWYSRLIIIPFYKTFRGNVKEVKKIGEKIVNKEIEIVLAWAIEGLKRLIDNKFKFTQSKIIENKLQEYRFQNDNFSKFVDLYCLIDDRLTSNEYSLLSKEEKYYIPNIELNTIYKAYCNDNNEKLVGKIRIVNCLNSFKVHEKHTVLCKGRYWEGIAWNKNVEELTNEYLTGTIRTKDKKDSINNLSDELHSSNVNYLKEYNSMSSTQLKNTIELAFKILVQKEKSKILNFYNELIMDFKKCCDDMNYLNILYSLSIAENEDFKIRYEHMTKGIEDIEKIDILYSLLNQYRDKIKDTDIGKMSVSNEFINS